MLYVGQSDWPSGIQRAKPWLGPRKLDWHELWSVRNGQGLLKSDDCEWVMQRGNVFLIQSGVTYEVTQNPDAPLRTLFVGFRMNHDEDQFFRCAPAYMEHTKWDFCEYMMNLMLDLYWEAYLYFANHGKSREARLMRTTPRGDFMKDTRVNPFPPNPGSLYSFALKTKHPAIDNATSVFHLLIDELIRRNHTSSPHQVSGLTKLQFDMISTAAMSIYNNPGRYRTVAEVASEHHYSTDHFTRLFKKVIGLHPRQHLINSRIDKARSWLADSELSIKEISNHLGYRNPQFFTRQFKECTGVSPSAFRRSKG